tara:strand:- start:441 stop:770 length:330 start_codon:yes stop_codon:yes gene_type:complete
LQFASANTKAQNCKRVCLANAHSELNYKHRKNKLNEKSTTYNNAYNTAVTSGLNKFPNFKEKLVQRINTEWRRHCPRLIRTLRFPLSLTQNVGTAEAAAKNPPYHMQNR